MIARIEEILFRITKERDLALQREPVYKIIPARATDQAVERKHRHNRAKAALFSCSPTSWLSARYRLANYKD